MSFVRLVLGTLGSTSRVGLQRVIAARSFSQSFVRQQQEQKQSEETSIEASEEENTGPVIDPRSDRSKVIPVETSIKYLQSDAYKETYGKDLVWKKYRRNYGRHIHPKKTRKTCIRQNMITTSNPCPICRDEYLVLDHRNIALINQFISPYNGEIISFDKTGLCQKQHQNLLIAIHRAKEFGTIAFDVPFREYDYSDWYNPQSESVEKPKSESVENPRSESAENPRSESVLNPKSESTENPTSESTENPGNNPERKQ